MQDSNNLPYEKIGKEPRCIADEIPFDIPDSWEWVRLKEIIVLQSGQDLTPEKYNDKNQGVPYITGASNFLNGNLIINRWTQYPKSIAHQGDLLITCKGTVGEMAFLSHNSAHIARQVMAITPLCCDYSKYICLYLNSYITNLNAVARSMIPGISRDDILHIIFPLPPLAEQKRIVAKIEELLPHLEDYDRAETRVTKLNVEFPEQLKKSILQWAIQGKLVPQDPTDEPASVLLDRIRTEKAKLFKAGKIKKDKNESVIFRRDNSHYTVHDGKEVCLDDKLPFEIPLSWSWVKLKELLKQASTGPFGSMLHKSDYVESGVPLVNPANIEGTQISDVGIKKVSIETAERLRSYKLFSGDVIIGRRGELGRSAVVPDNAAGWLCGTGCFFVTTNAALLPDYLVFLLASPYIREALLEKAVGTTMNNLNHGILGDLLIPLPPAQEQRRILIQWDELIKRFFA